MPTPDQKRPIRVLIVDDQTLFATSLRLVLENTCPGDFKIVGIASNGLECLDLLSKVETDVVLMDVYMPEMDGVEAAERVHREHPQVKVMMLTTFDDDVYVKKALRSGASGYVLKTIDAEELIPCVKAVAQGLLLMSPAIRSALLSASGKAVPEAVDPGTTKLTLALRERFPELRQREAEILLLVLRGGNNHQIAEELRIAEQTVRNYTSAIYSKIGVDDRLQAIQLFGSLAVEVQGPR